MRNDVLLEEHSASTLSVSNKLISRLIHGQHYSKRRSFSFFALNFDITVVFLDDIIHYCKAETGPLVLGRKKGFVDFIDRFPGDSPASVRNLDHR